MAASTLSWSLAFRLYFKKAAKGWLESLFFHKSPSTAQPSKDEQARSCPLALFLNDQGLLLEVFLSRARQVCPGRSTSFSCQKALILATSVLEEGPVSLTFGMEILHPSVFNQCFNSFLWWILKNSLWFLQTLNLSFMLKWRNQRILGSEMSNREFPPIHHFQHSRFLSSKIPTTSVSWAYLMVTDCCGDRSA